MRLTGRRTAKQLWVCVAAWLALTVATSMPISTVSAATVPHGLVGDEWFDLTWTASEKGTVTVYMGEQTTTRWLEAITLGSEGVWFSADGVDRYRWIPWTSISRLEMSPIDPALLKLLAARNEWDATWEMEQSSLYQPNFWYSVHGDTHGLTVSHIYVSPQFFIAVQPLHEAAVQLVIIKRELIDWIEVLTR